MYLVSLHFVYVEHTLHSLAGYFFSLPLPTNFQAYVFYNHQRICPTGPVYFSGN